MRWLVMIKTIVCSENEYIDKSINQEITKSLNQQITKFQRSVRRRHRGATAS